MFDLDEFIGACIASLDETEPRAALKAVLERAVAEPDAVARALPMTRAELVAIHSSESLTITKVVWAPSMSIPPHDHRMWAMIGIYGGAEDNEFFRRSDGSIVPAGGRHLATSDVTMLGSSTIHAVANPRQHAFTGAIHIYGGDFMLQPRSMWDPETLVEGPSDSTRVQALFEAANEKRVEDRDADRSV